MSKSPDAKSPEAFRTISEVSEWLDTPTYVLRFWESRFSQIKPVKRAGGRRYYRPDDMLLLGGIKQLLHFDEKSIKDVKALLKDEGVKHVMGLSPDLNTKVVSPKSKADAEDAADIDKIVTSNRAKKKPSVEVRVVKKAKVAEDAAKGKTEVADATKETPAAVEKAAAPSKPKEAPVKPANEAEQGAMAKAKAEEAARVKAAKEAAALKQAADEEADEWGQLVPDMIKDAPFRIKSANGYDADAMEEIETLYYSLAMARNSIRRARKQQEKRAG